MDFTEINDNETDLLFYISIQTRAQREANPLTNYEGLIYNIEFLR